MAKTDSRIGAQAPESVLVWPAEITVMPQQVETLPVDELARRVSQTLAPREEVLEAYLFGSHAVGAARAHSFNRNWH